jgi:hypothetical protein
MIAGSAGSAGAAPLFWIAATWSEVMLRRAGGLPVVVGSDGAVGIVQFELRIAHRARETKRRQRRTRGTDKHCLGGVPRIMNPANRTLLPVPTCNRVEMLPRLPGVAVGVAVGVGVAAGNVVKLLDSCVVPAPFVAVALK